jgi:4-hydroxy-tetrahydrodipicolinate synthase
MATVRKEYDGVFTALVTPFQNNLLDLKSFENLLDAQISAGVAGLVIGGTTGEGATLEAEELESMVKLALQKRQSASDAFKIIVSTGSNCTNTTIRKTLAMQALGVLDVMLVTPYYNKPTPEGLWQHYKAVHDATNVSIMLYDVPSRVTTKLDDVLLVKLSQLPRIKALKDCGGNVNRPLLLSDCELEILCGDDAMTLAYGMMGASGCVSVTSNLIPEQILHVHKHIQAGELGFARAIHKQLLALHEAMFVETNPAPVKHALALKGTIKSSELRLPLVQLTGNNAKIVEQVVRSNL